MECGAALASLSADDREAIHRAPRTPDRAYIRARNPQMTAYLPLKPIRFTDLFDGKLEPFGVREHINEHTTASQRCLTDGNNFMWA